MKLIVTPEIWTLFPNLRILVLIANLPQLSAEQLESRNAKISARWTAAWNNLAAQPGKPSAHPNVTAFKTALKGAGIKVSSYPPAIEALTKRVKPDSKPFSVNPFVDFYNSICLTNILPSGAFDIDEIAKAGHDHDIVLRKSVDGDTFQALDDNEPKPLPAGEIGYFTGPVGLSRHFIWRQSKQALLHETSHNFVVVAEFVDGISEEAGQKMEESLVDGFRDVFGVEVKKGVLKEGSAEIELA